MEADFFVFVCYAVGEEYYMKKASLFCVLLLAGCAPSAVTPSASPATAQPEVIDAEEEFYEHFPQESIVAQADGDENSSFAVALLSQIPGGSSNHLHVMDQDGTFQSVVIGDRGYYVSEDGFSVSGNTITFTLWLENEKGEWGEVKTEIEAVVDGRNIHWKNMQS